MRQMQKIHKIRRVLRKGKMKIVVMTEHATNINILPGKILKKSNSLTATVQTEASR